MYVSRTRVWVLIVVYRYLIRVFHSYTLEDVVPMSNSDHINYRPATGTVTTLLYNCHHRHDV